MPTAESFIWWQADSYYSHINSAQTATNSGIENWQTLSHCFVFIFVMQTSKRFLVKMPGPKEILYDLVNVWTETMLSSFLQRPEKSWDFSRKRFGHMQMPTPIQSNGSTTSRQIQEYILRIWREGEGNVSRFSNFTKACSLGMASHRRGKAGLLSFICLF